MEPQRPRRLLQRTPGPADRSDFSLTTDQPDARGSGNRGVPRSLAVALVFAAVLIGLVMAPAVDAASNWVVHVGSTNSGEGKANVLPAAPASPAAACTSPASNKTIKVSWSAVTHATTYSVFQSTTSSTGTYTSIATGVTATSWTSGTTAGNYWFKVEALVGSNWTSPQSAATAENTITASSCAAN